ncbi:Gfo/Idh/MocA family protein [Falsirhodobacter sp. 20TX0035]|uniref:Gfo/Idh/MocA family protein n=1 Tax=Falsirhodobacter sp. 20TX0035 TaxID=3022019 RepID=UPI002FE44008
MSGTRPRVAFVGLGWIGRHRMEGILDLVEPVALADPFPEGREEAAALCPGAQVFETLEEALATKPDGVVIATPSAMHAEQSVAALTAGCAVFCQKPLGRSAVEVQGVVDAARASNRLLHVDLSYRGTSALRAIHAAVQRGDIGKVFAVDLVFHNAYGPGKPWFYDKAQSGGGPLMDLGVHLIDSALWCLNFPQMTCTTAEIYGKGAPGLSPDAVEDYASATLRTEDGTALRLACSWNLHAGREAVIEVHLHGTEGGLSLTNPGGDFYDFEARLHRGTTSERIAAPPDPWGIAMIRDWATRLGQDASFDPAAERYVDLARVIDDIYTKGAR